MELLKTQQSCLQIFLGTSDSAINTSLFFEQLGTPGIVTQPQELRLPCSNFHTGPSVPFTEPSFSQTSHKRRWETQSLGRHQAFRAGGTCLGFPSFKGLSGLGQTHLKDALWTIFFAHSPVPEEETRGQESINNFGLVVEDRPLSNGGTKSPQALPKSDTQCPAQPGGRGQRADRPASHRPLAGPKDAGRCLFEWERPELGAGADGGRGSWRAALRDPCVAADAGGGEEGAGLLAHVTWGRGARADLPRCLCLGTCRGSGRCHPPVAQVAAAAAASPSPPRSLHSPAPGR